MKTWIAIIIAVAATIGVFYYAGLVTMSLFVLMLICAIFAILAAAKNDLFFTLVEEGKAKAVMGLDGFQRMLVQYRDKGLDKKTFDIINASPTLWQTIFGGLRWVGIPGLRSLYSYHFRWATLRAQSGEVIRRDQKIDYILLKDDVYIATIKNAEAKGMVPLDIEFLVTACCVNPYKALFKAQDWMEMLINRIEAIFRQDVATYSFENLVVAQKKKELNEDLWTKICATGLIDELKNVYGIEVKALEMRSINPAGEAKKDFEAAAAKVWLSEKEAAGIIVLAEAEKKRMETVYETVKNYGELGLTLKGLETIEKASNKQGNWIIPAELKNVAKSLLGTTK